MNEDRAGHGHQDVWRRSKPYFRASFLAFTPNPDSADPRTKHERNDSSIRERGKDSELMARDVFAAARAGERTCERHSHDACSWRKSGHFTDSGTAALEPEAELARCRNAGIRHEFFLPESLRIRELFHDFHSFVPKHVGRKEIICASSSSRRPRRAANAAVASYGSS